MQHAALRAAADAERQRDKEEHPRLIKYPPSSLLKLIKSMDHRALDMYTQCISRRE